MAHKHFNLTKSQIFETKNRYYQNSDVSGYKRSFQLNSSCALTRSIQMPPHRHSHSQTRALHELKTKRIMNYKLIQVEFLPKEIANLKLLLTRNYFCRYGKVTNIYLTEPKINQDNINNQSGGQLGKNNENSNNIPLLNAYLTYESQLNSSLALLGIHNTEFKNIKIKAYFGTNRYCSNFLTNKVCAKQKCFYLHEMDQQNQAFKPEHAKQKHLLRACDIVKNNLFKVVALQKDQQKFNNQHTQRCRFRSIKTIVGKMIDKKMLTNQEYDRHWQRRNVLSQRIIMKKSTVKIDNKKMVQDEQETERQLSNNKNVFTKNLANSLLIQSQSYQKPQSSMNQWQKQGKQIKNNNSENEQIDYSEQVQSLIINKLIKQLSKPKRLSRFQFDQDGNLMPKNKKYSAQDPKTKQMREFMLSKLVQTK